MLNLSDIKNLPLPIKFTFLGIGGGSISAFLWCAFKGFNWAITGIVIFGIILIALLLLAYSLIIRSIKRKKIAPMEKGLLKNCLIKNIQDPQTAAQLDDLRNKFREGIDTYKVAGKNIYELPWYVVVGEPGSGKTEAIRHSNIGFPPGLQDLLQGTGGTVNMNWWFSDHAVLLDTAGDMVFDNVEAGGTDEWKEFLKLLKKFRPNCPINGILLVIPADTLIKDNFEAIEKKASKIAMQFDVLQRQLDIRFPVYVVVTKCDLVQGFRDFFEDINDSIAQHQIFGWSNPQPLDVPYSSDMDVYFNSIKTTLNQRRLVLLQDEIGGKAISSNKQTEVYFSFPANLEMICNRLKKYLDIVFKSGSSWSCKPLFFRGIYFTSSMREGAALDMELASFLNVEVNKLPDERIWGRDKAYFLRDLFVKKIFVEKGLVTNASDAKAAYTKRKVSLYGFAIFAILIMIVLNVYTAVNWNRKLGGLKKYLHFAARDSKGDTLCIIDHGCYSWNAKAKFEDCSDIPLNEFYVKFSSVVERVSEEGMPLIFKPISINSQDVGPDKIKRSFEKIYNRCVIVPVLNKTLNQFKNDANMANIKWYGGDGRPGEAFNALCNLIMLKCETGLLSDDSFYSAQKFLDPLFYYGFTNDTVALEEYKKRAENYNKPIRAIYEGQGKQLWPSKQVASLITDDEILENIDKFCRYWSEEGTNQPKSYAAIKEFKNFVKILDNFNTSYKKILDSKYKQEDISPEQTFNPEKYTTKFGQDYAEFEKYFNELKLHYLYSSKNQTLPAKWESIVNDYNSDIKSYYGEIEKLIEPIETKNEFAQKVLKMLSESRKSIQEKISDELFLKKTEELNSAMWSPMDSSLAEDIFDSYYKIHRLLKNEYPVALIFDVDEAANKLNSEYKGIKDELVQKGFDGSGNFVAILDYIYSVKKCELITNCLAITPLTAADITARISERSESESKLGFDYIGNNYSPQYTPSIAEEFLAGWLWIRNELTEYPKNVFCSDKQKVMDDKICEYFGMFIRYWLVDYADKIISEKIIESGDWRSQMDWIKNINIQEQQEYIEGCLLDFNKIVSIPPVECIEDSGILENFKKDSRRINLKSFKEDGLTNLILEWQKLPADVFQARNFILKQDIKDLYFRFTSGEPEEFLKQYSSRISLNMISVLALDYEKQIAQKFAELKNMSNKFPASFEVQDLAQQMNEVEALRFCSLVSQIDVSAEPVYVRTGDSKSDKHLERLSKLSETEVKESQLYRQIAGFLPPEGKKYYCKISVCGIKEQLESNRSAVAENIKLFKFTQGANTSTIILGEQEQRVLVAEYPSSTPLEVYIKQHTHSDKDYTLVLSGINSIWSGLRWLKDFGVGEPNGGIVDIIIPFGSENLTLRLKLDFFRDIECSDKIIFPSKDDWR